MLTSTSPLRRCLAVLFLMLLTACGGGSDNSNMAGGVGSGGTGSYTSGPVSGLGSIIVNKVRYGVDAAQLVRDDDVDGSVAHSTAELKLGMVVEVQGSSVTPGANGDPATATANRVKWGSALVGPVSAVGMSGAAMSSLTVLGQTVLITSATVTPASVTPGQVVEVHGLVSANGIYTATRIDVPATLPTSYKIVGGVRAVDDHALYMGSSGAELAIDYLGAYPAGLPSGVGPTARVRVWFGLQQSNGHWTATRITVDEALVGDSDEASLDGLLTQVPDASGLLYIEGRPVDASRVAASVRAALVLGERVRAEGRMQGGVLIASELSAGSSLEEEDSGTELHGAVSALDGSAHTMVVRSVTVSFTDGIVHGNRALANGVCVEVHGSGYNASRQLIATEVEVQDSCD